MSYAFVQNDRGADRMFFLRMVTSQILKLLGELHLTIAFIQASQFDIQQ